MIARLLEAWYLAKPVFTRSKPNISLKDSPIPHQLAASSLPKFSVPRFRYGPIGFDAGDSFTDILFADRQRTDDEKEAPDALQLPC